MSYMFNDDWMIPAMMALQIKMNQATPVIKHLMVKMEDTSAVQGLKP